MPDVVAEFVDDESPAEIHLGDILLVVWKLVAEELELFIRLAVLSELFDSFNLERSDW
jgi:hypothetical protein